MAWVRCCGGSGLSSKFIYKDGVVNTALCGGLTGSGYTFKSGYSVAGNTVTFNANNIVISASDWSNNTSIIGTVNTVNLTNVNTIIVTYIYGGVTRTITYSTSSLTGSYYISFGVSNNQYGNKDAWLAVSVGKTNTYDEGFGAMDRLQTSGGAIGCTITQIELA